MEQPVCILALDLGTSAFKAAPVSPAGLVAEPVSIPYELDQADGRVTCRPERYFDTAIAALRRAACSARAAGCRVEAVGISSQAQTYIALDRTGAPLGDAVVWTDNRAEQEAERASQAIPDVAAHCGFRRFTGQQFLPKVMLRFAEGGMERDAIGKLLLLNEYLAYRLTGIAYGDETNQGMSGFFDITRRVWSPTALSLAGIAVEHLADVAPAAERSGPLTPEIRRALDLDAIPVYLCGNDQTCAAAGVDLDEPGSVLCNFGTAMVIYARKESMPSEILETQIAGIDPLTSRYFLLGLEGECGNVIEWLAHRVYPTEGIEHMLDKATKSVVYPARHEFPAFPVGPFRLGDWQESFEKAASALCPKLVAQTILEIYRARFVQLLAEARGLGTRTGKPIAAGGLCKSQAWLDFLAQRTSEPLVRAPSEHPGLLGIARIVEKNSNKEKPTWSIDSSL